MESSLLISGLYDSFLPFFMYPEWSENLDTDSVYPETALTTYEQAIALAPRQAVLHYHKGQILEQMGRATDAETAYEAARNLGYHC